MATPTRTVSDVRPLSVDGPDFDRFVDIAANAYPVLRMFSAEARQRFKERIREADREPGINLWGAYRGGALVGGMRLFDFSMRIRSAEGLTGGVGLVVVDLLRKKEGIARDLIAAFLAHYRSRGATMAALHPFRPDFYRQMGFGYGTRMNQYRVKPSALPRGGAKDRVRFLGPDDAAATMACYDRACDRTNGLIRKSHPGLERLLGNPEARVVGYERDGAIRAYLAFRLQQGRQENLNELYVLEFIHESPESLAGIMAFLHSQADQFATIVFNTQEEGFQYLPADPRNGTDNILFPPAYHETNTQGIGIMYRVIDTPGVFILLGDHDFGGQTCTLKLSIRGSFFPPNDGDVVVRFTGGAARVTDDPDHDVAVALDVAEFSSLLMGAVGFRSLYDFGLATISDPAHIATVDRIFAADQKPICTTAF